MGYLKTRGIKGWRLILGSPPSSSVDGYNRDNSNSMGNKDG